MPRYSFGLYVRLDCAWLENARSAFIHRRSIFSTRIGIVYLPQTHRRSVFVYLHRDANTRNRLERREKKCLINKTWTKKANGESSHTQTHSCGGRKKTKFMNFFQTPMHTTATDEWCATQNNYSVCFTLYETTAKKLWYLCGHKSTFRVCIPLS